MPVFDHPYVVTDPLGDAEAKTLDNIIRELKSAIQDRQNLEHYSYDPSGDGTDDSAVATACGRHKPGYVSCLLYGTYAAITGITGTGGQIAYSTTAPVGFLHYVLGEGWQVLSMNSDDVVADEETLEFTGSDPSTLAMKHDNQQWTTTDILTDAAIIAINCNDSNSFSVTLGSNRIIGQPTNMEVGATYVFIITQDATGSRTLTWASIFKWPSGVAPTLTTAAGSVDIITCIATSSTVAPTVVNALRCSVIYDIQ